MGQAKARGTKEDRVKVALAAPEPGRCFYDGGAGRCSLPQDHPGPHSIRPRWPADQVTDLETAVRDSLDRTADEAELARKANGDKFKSAPDASPSGGCDSI